MALSTYPTAEAPSAVAEVEVRVAIGDLGSLSQLARSANLSEGIVAAAAFQLLIAHYSVEEDVTHKLVLACCGAPTVSAVLRVLLNPALTLRELVGTIQRNLHGEVSTPPPSRAAILAPLYAFEWLEQAADAEAAPYAVFDDRTKPLLSLTCQRHASELCIVVRFSAVVYSKARMHVFANQFARLLRRAPADVDKFVTEIALFSDWDSARPRLDEPNSISLQTGRIFDAFLEQVQRAPNALAIAYGEQTWTYAELEEATRSLAVRLTVARTRRTRVRPSAPQTGRIAIYGRRNPELVIAMLACARSGQPFAVLDANYPVGRLAQQFAAMGADHLLLASESVEDVRTVTGLCQHDQLLRATLGDVPADSVQTATDEPVLDQAKPDAIAYLLFTSGTTGTPKCVQTNHRPLVHFVDWYSRQFDVSRSSRFSMLSGLGHDPVLRDIFVPLSCGAQLHIPKQSTTTDPNALFEWLQRSAVTHLHGTPQIGKIIHAGSAGSTLSALRYILCGGDALHAEHARDMQSLGPAVTVVNFYGATETPQAIAFHVFESQPGETTVPVGKGIDDVQLLVLTANAALAAIGVSGQIGVRTRYLSSGYINDESLTRAQFLKNPAASDDSDQIYLTGDYGYFRTDGSVVVTGRRDGQVKVRGFRVELAEVVSHVKTLDGVADAVVLARTNSAGETALDAFVARSPGARDSEERALTVEARAVLGRTLPNYMVPQGFYWLEALPLLPNGKPDRSKLQALVESATKATTETGQNDLEATLIRQWRGLLGEPSTNASSTFLLLGGDSLSFIQASIRLERLLGWLPKGWEGMTIRELARIGTRPKRRISTVSLDPTIVLRALSILMIVSGASGGPELHGGTKALFLVSGVSFYKYQLRAVLLKDSIAPIGYSALKVALPTALYTLAMQVLFSQHEWRSVLLLSNFVSPVAGGPFSYWFVYALVQSQLILAALLMLPQTRDAARRYPFATSVWAWLSIATLCALSWLVWDTTYLFDRVPQKYLGLMLVGWLVAAADTTLRKWLATAAVAATVGGLYLRSPDALLLPLMAGCGVLWLPLIPVPTHLATLISRTASASLFIYLTAPQVGRFVSKTPLSGHWSATVIVSAVCGMLCVAVWDRLVAVVSRTLKGTQSVDPGRTAEGAI